MRDISIHSLRVEGDLRFFVQALCNPAFQSTPSVWRETVPLSFFDSILVFQSTPSVWRETCWNHCLIDVLKISIHSLRVEGDSGQFNAVPPDGLFQSTPSVWRETC